jgi:hypothetical protein
LEFRHAGDSGFRLCARLVVHGLELSETLLDGRVSGIDLKSRSQFLGGLVQLAREGITFRGFDVSANQLGA